MRIIRRKLCDKEAGSAVAETALTLPLLLMLLLAVAQVLIYAQVRTLAIASAAEGARYSAAEGAEFDLGAARAHTMLAQSVGNSSARHVSCQGSESMHNDLSVVKISCQGRIPLFFLPVGQVIPLKVDAHAYAE